MKSYAHRFAPVLAALSAIVALGANTAPARASNCEIKLRTLMVDGADCGYYVTAFRMMGNKKVNVDAVCKRGTFKDGKGPRATKYTGRIKTKLTVLGSSCGHLKPLKMTPVLLSRPNCEHLQQVVGMLGTDFVDVRPECRYGAWTGADGSPRTSMVDTRMTLKHGKQKSPRRLAQK